jgi:hypothetical protein
VLDGALELVCCVLLDGPPPAALVDPWDVAAAVFG